MQSMLTSLANCLAMPTSMPRRREEGKGTPFPSDRPSALLAGIGERLEDQ